MFDTMVTIQGHVASDVTLRTTKSGAAVASFRIATTPRRLDKAIGQWVDGPVAYYSVSCWKSLAENVAASVTKGMPVVVHGRLTHRQYDREVGSHTVQMLSCEITATTVGHDLGRGVAAFQKVKSQSVTTAEQRALADAEQIVTRDQRSVA